MDTIVYKNGVLKILDQTKLPRTVEFYEAKNYLQSIQAIKNMVVRGAPAISMVGAFSYAQAIKEGIDSEVAKKEILKSRPTAVDLSNAIEFMKDATEQMAENKAMEWARKIEKMCKKISELGATLIDDGNSVLTHCNAGPIACGYHGTALGAIIEAWKAGKKIFVYVKETRPRFQGGLTSWELSQYGVPHVIIVDSAFGLLMQRGKIDSVFVGADRIVRNGDVANKIGTHPIAVVAKEYGISFYVLAPSSTLDRLTATGKDIRIEERDEKEILNAIGIDASAYNPAFDITPQSYVTAYITEKGIFRSADELWKSTKE